MRRRCRGVLGLPSTGLEKMEEGRDEKGSKPMETSEDFGSIKLADLQTFAIVESPFFSSL